jgi:hypothetical protein
MPAKAYPTSCAAGVEVSSFKPTQGTKPLPAHPQSPQMVVVDGNRLDRGHNVDEYLGLIRNDTGRHSRAHPVQRCCTRPPSSATGTGNTQIPDLD